MPKSKSSSNQAKSDYLSLSMGAPLTHSLNLVLKGAYS